MDTWLGGEDKRKTIRFLMEKKRASAWGISLAQSGTSIVYIPGSSTASSLLKTQPCASEETCLGCYDSLFSAPPLLSISSL